MSSFNSISEVHSASTESEPAITSRSRAKHLRERIHALADLAVDVTKLGAAISVPCGAWLLISYLQSENAPVPALDTSLATVLSIITVVFVFITTALASLVLMPAYSRLANDRARLASIREGSLYFGLYFTIVSGPVTYLVLGMARLENYVCTIFGFVACVVVLIFWCLARTKAQPTVPLLDLVMPTGLCLLWFSTLVSLFSYERSKIVRVFILVCSMLVPPLIATLVDNWKKLLLFYASLVFVSLFLWPGAPYLGGLVLRMLGMGGEIPVSIIVKATPPGDSQPKAIELSGCLVLAMGGDVLIKPTTDITDCKLHWKFGFTNESEFATYKAVERYSRSDIVNIRGFPSREDTVDGLPVLGNAKHQ